MRKPLVLLAATLGLATGCKASVKAEVHAATTASVDDHQWETQKETWEAPKGVKPSKKDDPVALEVAKANDPFVGVTHDLSIAPTAPRPESCKCLTVAFGSPSDPVFEWKSGSAPSVPDDVFAVAIAGDNVACEWKVKAGRGKLRELPVPVPSIAGVERVGEDVVVSVEAARDDRPVARGALSKRPGPTGGIIVRGRGKVPFGTPASGAKGRCRIAVAPPPSAAATPVTAP